jgi:hypothetical protein
MITHIVLFKPKPETTQSQIDAALKNIDDLQQVIPEILSVQIGKNLNESHNQGYTYGFVMQFSSKEHLDIYVQHPAHRTAGRGLVAISESIVDFDLPS